MNPPPPSFAIDIASLGDASVRIEVQGDLDLATSPALANALSSEIDRGMSVLLDLSGVTFIDSTGLNTLIRALRLCEVSGGALTVCPELPDQVSRVFEITGLDTVLPIASG